jgi:hypothetical protein
MVSINAGIFYGRGIEGYASPVRNSSAPLNPAGFI